MLAIFVASLILSLRTLSTWSVNSQNTEEGVLVIVGRVRCVDVRHCLY